MNAKLQILLEGSGITAESSPVLVSLLELAAAGPGLGDSTSTLRMRLMRQWQKEVVPAFGQCVAAGVTDEHVLACQPFEDLDYAPPGVNYAPPGWVLTTADPLTYRQVVARALEKAAAANPPGLVASKIETVADLRKAQAANRIPDFDAPLALSKAEIVSPLLPGRRLVVKRVVDGAAVFLAREANEYGQMRTLCAETRQCKALEACETFSETK